MTDEQLRDIWDEVVGVDVGIDPTDYGRAILSTVPSIDEISSILASEIECSIFERYVIPALEIARLSFIKE